MKISHPPLSRIVVLSAGFLASSCTATPTATYANLGQLHDAIEAARSSDDPAVRLDTDGDGIPDGIEMDLLTTIDDRDSDHDGLVDNAELFGFGSFDRRAPIPDRDGDGAIAPIDDDDDGDGVPDGASIDSDGDGIANYLEYYGYSYDWLTETFVPWDGDPATPHYRTDPLQASTDQDAYSDAMEVTGIGLDVTVDAPGDHPLVPAVPNVVLELLGYSVTLNETVAYGENQTLADQTTWNRETSETHSYTSERSWEAGIEVGTTANFFHFLAHANYGESYATTQSTTTSIAMGGSALDAHEWSVARTTNPTDAAHLALYVRAHNLGSAPLSAIVPTITLRIGGLNVATFQPANAQANLLVPGGSYPEDPTVAWVIESIDTGGGAAPLSLTMRELRALENGAPISLTVTQTSGDVMRLSDDDVWESVGDASQYVARCEAVSASVRFDLGDGTVTDHLVHAGTSESGVPITLGDALTLLGVDDENVLHFIDRRGQPRSVSLEGYDIVVDAATLRENGWTLDEGPGPGVPPVGLAFEDTRIFPSTSVLVRAPRDVASAGGPVVHYAYADSIEGDVRVCADDYQGIASVVVRNEAGDHMLELTEDLAGACFFSAIATAATLPLGAAPLTVTVTNLRGDVVEAPVETLYFDPGPRAPIIREVRLDLASKRIYANVESGAPSDPHSELEWVRVYHPGLPNGYLALAPVSNAFEDPNGYVVSLPNGFASADVEVVAYVAPGVYARHRVASGEVTTPLFVGTVYLAANIDTTGTDEEWTVPRFDLDLALSEASFFEADVWSDTWTPASTFDLWVAVDESPTGWLHFNAGTRYARVTGGTSYESLTRDQAQAYAPSFTDTLPLGQAEGAQVGDIFVVQTDQHRFAKIRVVSLPTYDNGWTNFYARNLVIEYLVWP